LTLGALHDVAKALAADEAPFPMVSGPTNQKRRARLDSMARLPFPRLISAPAQAHLLASAGQQ
jgi:hypothetical protein